MLSFRLLRCFSALVLLAGLGSCAPKPQPAPAVPAKTSGRSVDEAEASRFLPGHWARPLAAQGPLPAALAAQGISLAPQSCASCHATQFEDWSKSLHSRAMGPGVLGQLLNMPAHARGDHQDCIRCHAPLAEQADSLVAAIEKLSGENPGGIGQPGPLHEQGLVCASCHVRNNTWYGPPRRDGSQPADAASAQPHSGWTASSAFESSQFCSACHQFMDDGYSLNGKLLENTYREWQGSRFARDGISCQSCHMPDRRHLWRGIHDPEMVKKGVEISAESLSVAKGQVAAQLDVANSGVGHYFPTYVTPKLVIRAVQIDAQGDRLKATEQEFVIGRQLSQDLSQEITDTRIAPDARASFDYRKPRHVSATALAWEVQVQPDAFYLEFYESLLREAAQGTGKPLIKQARDAASASPYFVYSTRLPLP